MARNRLLSPLVKGLLRHGVKRSYAAGALIHNSQDQTDGFAIILSGSVSLFRLDRNGQRHASFVAGPGEMFGVLPTLSERFRSHDCEAIEPVEICEISRETLWREIDDNPAIRRGVIDLLCTRMTRLLDHIEDGQRLSFPKQLAKHLLEIAHSDGIVPYSQSDLAGQTGASRNTVGSALKEIASQGYIRTRYGRVEIFNIDALDAWAS